MMPVCQHFPCALVQSFLPWLAWCSQRRQSLLFPSLWSYSFLFRIYRHSSLNQRFFILLVHACSCLFMLARLVRSGLFARLFVHFFPCTLVTHSCVQLWLIAYASCFGAEAWLAQISSIQPNMQSKSLTRIQMVSSVALKPRTILQRRAPCKSVNDVNH